MGVWYKSECSRTIWRDTVVREVGSGGRGHMDAYGLLMLMYSKNHHNIEKKKNKKLSDGVRPEHRIKAFPHLKHLCSFPPGWIFWRSKRYILLYLCVSFHCSMDFQIICNIIPCDQRVCHINNIYVVSLLYDLPNGQFMLNMH